MKCKSCKRELPDNAVFCCWCGKEQIKKKDDISVPKPRQKADGTWTAQIMVKGKRVSVPPQTTEAKYYVAAKALKTELVATKDKAPDITLSEAIDLYIADRPSLKTTTKQNYEYIKKNRFPDLMRKKISTITGEDLEKARETESQKKSRKGGKLSPGTVNDALHLCTTVLAKYAKLEADVSSLEEQRKFPNVLSPEKIYPAVKGTDIELPCLLAMWLGMSASEIRGLTKNKSIRDGKIYIVETVVTVYGKSERREGGKEETRPRCYDIPPYIQTLIDNVEGDIIEKRSAHALNQRLQTEINRAGLPHITFHSLRKTSASVMVSEHVPTTVAQQRGGWKTDDTMKRTYQFAFDEDRIAADKTINARFEKIISNE